MYQLRKKALTRLAGFCPSISALAYWMPAGVRRLSLRLLSITALSLCAAPALAQTTLWTGGTGSWFTGSNWSAGAPGPGYDVNVASGTPQIAGSTGSIQSLTIWGFSTVDLQTGGTLSTTNGVSIGDGHTPGTLLLSGSSNLSGPITIAGGTLSSAFSGTLSNTIMVDPSTGGFLNTQSGTVLILDGSISGATLDLAGAGKVILTGNANSIGVQSGATLQIGNGGTTGSLGSGAIVNDGTLIFAHSDNVTLPAFFLGNGNLIQAGTGTLFVSTSSSYAGQATIISGTLALTGTGGFSIGAGSVIFNNATFDISGISGSNSSIGSLNGNGVVVLGNKSLTILNSGGAFYGVISGSGGLNISMTGTQALGGANTYTGTTTVDHGTLRLEIGSSLASKAVNINNGGVVEFNGSFTPTNTTITVNSGGTLFSRSFGTTQLAGSKVIMVGGLLDTDPSATGLALGSLEGSGTVNLHNNALTVGSLNTDTTLAATVTGSSQLNKIGTGTLTLTGSNAYPSGVSVNSGTVVLGPTGSLTTGSLSVRTGGVFVAAAPTSINNLFFNSGTVAAAPGVTLNFTNNVDFFTPGPLVFGSPTLTGTITLAAPGCCIPFNSTVEIAGGTVRDLTSPSSPGDGNGSLSFAAYMAPLFTVDAGATADFNDHSVRYSAQPSKGLNLRGAGQILLGTNASTEMQVRSTNFSGVISGAGKVTFLSNASAHLLTGNNTYTGGSTINSGASLQLGSGGTTGSIAGNIVNNGALTFNRSDAVSFANVISGSGSLTKLGAGSLTLFGTNTYTGATTVSAGTLNVTGTIASSSVSVASGATLGGTGTVGSTAVASGGTLAPGNSIGTLTVNGNLTLAAGSSYNVEVLPTAADRTVVSGAASLNGTVMASVAPGAYGRFAILTATGGVSGTFAALTGLPTSLKGQLSYDTSNAYLTLSPNTLTPLLSNATPNQQKLVSAIDAGVTAGNLPGAGFQALYDLSGPALNSALDQISGQVGPNTINAVGQASLSFLTMTAQGGSGGGNFAPDSAYGGADAPHRAQLGAGETRVWASAYGGHVALSADAVSGAASLSSSNVGLIGGADMAWDGGLLAGVTVGLGRQNFSSGNGTGSSDDIMIGVYARKDAGPLYVTAAFGYGSHRIETLRVVTVSGTDVLQGKQNADDYGGRLEAGWRMALDEQYSLSPYFAVSAENFDASAYAETALSGASTFALSFAPHSSTLGRTELGSGLSRNYQTENGVLTADLRAAWAHQLDDVPFTQASFQTLPGAGFLVTGVRPSSDAALLGAGIQVQNRSGLFFGFKGETQLGAGTTILEGMGHLGWRW